MATPRLSSRTLEKHFQPKPESDRIAQWTAQSFPIDANEEMEPVTAPWDAFLLSARAILTSGRSPARQAFIREELLPASQRIGQSPSVRSKRTRADNLRRSRPE